MAQYKLVKCTINGKPVEKMIDVRASLTDMQASSFSASARAMPEKRGEENRLSG